MLRMATSCNQEQQRLGLFLVILVIAEVTLICAIIKFEHKHAQSIQMKKYIWRNHSRRAPKRNIPNGFRKNSVILQVVESLMNCRQKTSVNSTTVHFNLGNDDSICKSSYQVDYGILSRLHTYRPLGKPKSPKGARILPDVVKGAERYTWTTSNMLDFSGFGNEARKRAYETSRGDFKETKAIQTKDNGLLKDDYAIPQKTRYKTDFQLSGPVPEITFVMNISQNSLRKVYGKRNLSTAMISEARHAFQWPSRDRIKLPIHINNRKVSG